MGEEVIIVPVVMFTIYSIVKLVMEHSTRTKLISQGLVDEKIKFLFNQHEMDRPLNNLKWGMVLLGIGVAWLLRDFGPLNLSDEGTFGLMFIFAGVGFLVYYFVAENRYKNRQKENQQ